MRGEEKLSDGLFSYVRLDNRVAKSHPLRPIRELVEAVLSGMSGRFAALYSHTGRPSIPPEQLLKALLLQAFSVRSERQLMEHLDYNFLFRCFVGLPMDAGVWDATTFCKNRDRLLEGDVAREFLPGILNETRVKRLLSSDHFSVDGTLVEAWASMKSFRPKDENTPSDEGGGRNRDVDFKGERRSNETHASTTDKEARLHRKSPCSGATLCFMGHALMENRNGLVVDAILTPVSGHAERDAALAMIETLADWPAVREAIAHCGAAFIGTDLRAHLNSTRMQAVARYPRSRSPVAQPLPGLRLSWFRRHRARAWPPCEWCGAPTQVILPRCQHQGHS